MRPTTRLATVLLAVAALGLSACSASTARTAVLRGANRTVDVAMIDNAYRPNALQVSRGETVVFRFKNYGTNTHEALIADEATQEEHEGEMATMGTGSTMAGTMGTAMNMDGGDAGGMANMEGGATATTSGPITVEPGQSGELTHTFDEAGTIFIGCHEPGHWASGMKATVTVV